MKTTKTTFKLTALFLTLAMLFCMIPVSAVALESETAITETTQVPSASPSQGESSAEENFNESAPEEALGLGELSTEVLATMEVNSEDIPEVIPMARAQEKGLVNRLYAQEESLSTVLFQTKSGSKTAYVFGKPVKYVDAEGNVQDKSTAISAMLDTTYAYAMLDNSVKVYFPRSITSGVLLSYNGCSITMKPETDGSFAPIYNEESNAVGYAGVFGSTSILAYTPTLYGVKEDIVLVKYEGENSFDFIMTLQGLTAAENESGIWELLDARGKAVANLGNVIVKDSAGKTAYGELNVVSLGNSQYRVTVTAPEEFMEAEDTVYPVYVDPTTTINESEERWYADEDLMEYSETVDAIIDVGLYQHTTDYNRAINSPTEHYLGEYDYNGRIIYKFYDFYGEHGLFTDLKAGQIGRATLYVTAFDYSEQTVSVNPMTSTWDTATYGENPVALLEDQVSLWDEIHETYGVSSFNITGDCEHAIDITEIARNWADYKQGITSASYADPANGFCLNADDSIYSIIMATESTYIYDNVYYEIDYSIYGEPYYLVSKINEERYQSLQKYYDGEESIFVIDDFSANIDSQWIFEYLGTNSAGVERYRIYSAANNEYLRVLAGSHVSSGTVMSPENVWLLEVATGGYRIRSEYSPSYFLYNNNGVLGLTTNQSTAGVFWELLEESDFVALDDDFTLNSELLVAGQAKHLWVIPSPSNATHTGYSNFIWEFDEEFFTVNNAGFVTANTSDGGVYSKLTLTHRYTGDSKTFLLVTDIPDINTDSSYIIRNANNEKMIVRSSVTSTSPTHVDVLGEESLSTWMFEKNTDNLYTIYQSSGNRYLCMSGSSVTSRSNNPTYWKLIVDSDENYTFVPVNTTRALCGSNATQLTSTSNLEDNFSKWTLHSIDYHSYVEAYFDGAYLEKLPNTNAAIERVTGIMEKTQAYYACEFGLWLDFRVADKIFSSLGDECEMNDCNHNPCQNTFYDSSSGQYVVYRKHCTNIYNMLFEFINDISQLVAEDINKTLFGTSVSRNLIDSLFFTGHEVCVAESCGLGNSQPGIVNGAAVSSKNTAIIEMQKSDEEDDLDEETFITIHEFGHLIGADDHYKEGFGTEEKNDELPEEDVENGYCYSRSCIYGEDRNQGNNHEELPLCYGCRFDISYWLENVLRRLS